MLSPLDYHGWPAVILRSSELELIAPLDIGPRIISLRRADGGPNLFHVFEEQLGGSREAEYQVRGGHRLWCAPEDAARTCHPDNHPPAYSVLPDDRGFRLSGPEEPGTHLHKSLQAELIGQNAIRVTHTLLNRGVWPIETAAWALTMLRRGGMSIVPLPDKGVHPRDLTPTYSIVPWSYTDLSLDAWTFFPGFLRVETAKIPNAQKLGLTDYAGWSAYWLDGELFIKAAKLLSGATYPDRGCVFETYADATLTEFETLSPLQTVEPGRRIVHTETWGVLAGIPEPESESAYRSDILPAINRWLEAVD